MIPDLAPLHPQTVHFVIALLIVGVAFRVVSLTGRFRFTNPAATTLILIGAVAAWFAAASGDAAHGPAERIPGAREAVEEHEEWGERTRNLFTIVALIEVAILVTAAKDKRRAARGLTIASALVGLGGVFVLYETAEHGGAIVYEYAGGPGVRSGEPRDVQNLLVAGLYQQAMQARKEKRPDEAARLLAELARQRPNDPAVRQLAIESMLRDQNNPQGALDALNALPPAENPRQKTQRGMLRADAFAALGQRDSARAVIDALVKENPENPRLKAKADSLR